MSDNYTIEKKHDLLDFINTEIRTFNTGDTDLNRIFKYFYKCQVRIMFEMYDKLSQNEEVELIESLESGSNMVSHVFWTLYTYSLNIKLTMFLTERAVLLFTEFIIMSKNPLLNKEFRFMPNVSDALAFSLKKTIGPLKNNCNTKNKKFLRELNKYKSTSLTLKFLLQQVFHSIVMNKKKIVNLENSDDSDKIHFFQYESKYIKTDKDIPIILDNIASSFSQLLLNLNKSDKICFDILSNIFGDIKKDLTSKLCIAKIYLELYYEVFGILNDNILVEKILNYHLNDYKFDDGDLEINNLKSIKKRKNFKNMLKLIKNNIKNEIYKDMEIEYS